MSGIQSVGEPMEGAAINADSKQHTPTENVPPPNANANEESIPAEATNGDGFTPDFDFRSAAKKLKCDDDPDAVSSAIGIVLKELEDCKMKISFFETLFGYRTEHLMAYDEHILRYEDIRFYGQRRLKGRVLQQEMLRQNGHEPSLEELTGKVVVMSVPEDHYDFAVVLSLRGKGHVDRKLSSTYILPNVSKAALKFVSELQGQDVQIADNSAGAATEDVPADLQKSMCHARLYRTRHDAEYP